VEDLMLLETNIDDSTPQVVGYVMERVLDLGANDCWFTTDPDEKKSARSTAFCTLRKGIERPNRGTDLRETTTLGIRTRSVEREILERETVSVKTSFGNIDVRSADGENRF
jgi:uncharacterized protein (DUF111 family)